MLLRQTIGGSSSPTTRKPSVLLTLIVMTVTMPFMVSAVLNDSVSGSVSGKRQHARE